MDLIVPQAVATSLYRSNTWDSHQDPWFSKVAEGWPVSSRKHRCGAFGETSAHQRHAANGTEAGDVGTLNLRISNETNRIQSAPDSGAHVSEAHRLRRGGAWMLATGGMLTALVRNDGNDLSTLELSLSGLPQGWTTAAARMVLAPGEVQGLISILPSSDWDGTGRLITVSIDHPRLIQSTCRSR